MSSKRSRSNRLRFAVTAAIFASLPVEYAQAQLEEVVVTARKRIETLQEVPVSVSAISGDTIEQFGSVSVKDIAEMTPNLSVGRGSVSQNVAIRGFGTSISTGGFASSVGLGIDGMFFSQLPWLEIGMFDVQQVEVLRGPQGAYFGKNTTAGQINMVSRSPTEELEGQFTVGYETELEAYRFEGAISGALTDNLRARIAVQHLEDEGWMENAVTGEPVEAGDRDIFKLGFDWDVSDNVRLYSRTSYTDWEVEGNAVQVGECGPGGPLSPFDFLPGMVEDCVVDNVKTGGVQRGAFDANIQQFVDAGGIALGPFGTPYGNRSGVVNGTNDYRTIEAFSQSIGITWDLGEDSQIISVTGYSNLELDYQVDSDFFDSPIFPVSETPPIQALPFGPLLGFANFEEYEQFTQELRFESKVNDSVSYVVGLFYENSETTLRDATDFSIDLFSLFSSRNKGSDFDQDSIAVFGELRWDLAEDWTLSLGGRYTDESVDARSWSEVGSLGNPNDDDFLAQLILQSFGITEFNISDDRSSTDFSPSVVLQHTISDEGSLYLSYKEGFKSGGFDGSVSGPSSIPFYEFDDETVKSFEFGSKWETSSWRANFALFYTEYDDLQVQVFDGVAATVTRNAASATTRGFEFDALWAASDSLTFTLGVGYTDAEYDEFSNASCYAQQTPEQGCVFASQDLSGGGLIFAPEWSGNLGVNWVQPIGSGLELQLGAMANYRDEVWLTSTLDPASLEEELTLLNLTASLSGSDGRWSVNFIGRNITDEEYRTAFADIPFFDAHQIRLGTPATYEFQFVYRLF